MNPPVSLTSPMALMTASAAPPVPNRNGAEMVTVVPMFASAPLVMVSALDPAMVWVAAKKSEFTVTGAAGLVTAPVIRMF